MISGLSVTVFPEHIIRDLDSDRDCDTVKQTLRFGLLSKRGSSSIRSMRSMRGGFISSDANPGQRIRSPTAFYAFYATAWWATGSGSFPGQSQPESRILMIAAVRPFQGPSCAHVTSSRVRAMARRGLVTQSPLEGLGDCRKCDSVMRWYVLSSRAFT